MAENSGNVAKVDGVLIGNNDIRKEILKRIYWKDKQYTDFGNGDYVRNAEVTDREPSPIGEGKDLFRYTYDNDSEYSQEILRKNVANGVNHPAYEQNPIPDGQRWKWQGNYYENFDFDSPLYRIGQIKLSEGEILGKTANDNRFLDKKYITPATLKFYGNKITAQFGIMQTSLDNHMDGLINPGTGRMAEGSILADEAPTIVNDIYEAFNNALNPDTGVGEISLKEGYKSIYNNITGVTKYRGNAKANTPEENWKLPTEFYVNATRDNENGKDVIEDENLQDSTYLEIGGVVHKIYDEGDTIGKANSPFLSQDDETFVSPNTDKKGLLSKTAKLFNEHKIATLIGRFHTTINENDLTGLKDTTDTAKNLQYGNSHGRNLLAKNVQDINGYENPYCRVWTYHHQYDNVSKLIRPFSEGTEIQDYKPYKAIYPDTADGLDGNQYLQKNTVLGKNGFVNITPKGIKDYCTGDWKTTVETKKCMFSLENLAWKDVPNQKEYLSEEQRGPNGGRIMWFPPYDLDFQESVSVNWNSHTFIGRGEPVFTYGNTNRSGTLSFAILVDHPSYIDNIPHNNIKEEELSEEDILRFFAGCGVEDLSRKEDCSKVPEKKPQEVPTVVPPLSESKEAVFYVFFPDNYSGNYNNGDAISRNDYNINGTTDTTWFDYLAFGRNTSLPTDSITSPGYEVWRLHGQGITIIEACSPEHKSEGISVYTKNGAWEKPTGSILDNVWYTYKVDFDKRQNLKNKREDGKTDRGMDYGITNYADSDSFALNRIKEDKKNPGIAHSGATHSFIDILTAMALSHPDYMHDNGFYSNHYPQFYDGATSGVVDEDIINVFKNDESGYHIESIEIHGNATNQDAKNSNDLAERRNRALKDLMSPYFKSPDVEFKSTTGVTEVKNLYSVNSFEAKAARYSKVTIRYQIPIIEETLPENYIVKSTNNLTEEEKSVALSAGTVSRSEMRYENEADYFNEISREDPILYKNLVKKFKYFSPAFHSISPEGFNARLTFLQQCTRQGHTFEFDNVNGKTDIAGNLAFGRMPVCVLRLGDFLNTRIIINGMSISYGSSGPMQWDLNPEGVGVQPMYAKVNLQITILGGQSLEGPISRLQNAVSFNYYANTGVYDNRSDMIEMSTVNTKETTTVQTESDKVKENNSDKYASNNQYNETAVTYKHIFTPYPNNK